MDLTLRTALAGLVFALALGLGSGAQAAGTDPFVVIYDVDFGSPLHTVGNAPTTNTDPIPRAAPTTIRRNPVLVVDAFGGLVDQPMAFPGPGRGDVAFSLAGLPPCPAYRLAMDVVVDSDFRLLVSAPGLNLVHFQPDGDVELTVSDAVTGSQTATVVATYTPGDGAVHNFVMSMDLLTDNVVLELDGATVHDGNFGGQTSVTQFRILGAGSAVDDIVLDSGEEEASEIAAVVDVWPRYDKTPRIVLRSRGVVPVAILSTEELDAADVDTHTLLLSDTDGSDGVAPRWKKLKDIDGDCKKDLIMLFFKRDLVPAGVLSKTTTSLTLAGETFDGTALSGSDEVSVRLPRKHRRHRKHKSK